MKFGKDSGNTANHADAQESRDEMREMAEAISLYRSAMHHVAEKRAARLGQVVARPAKSMRMRLLLVPALGAALAVAVMAPILTHSHARPTPAHSETAARIMQPAQEVAQASVNDTELMDRINSDLTQDVPDALEPLAGLSEQTTTTTTTSSEKN
ncbi:MAG TPA: hypothetical protein VHX60_18320 [Acidobacteriaceae bacterium]|jgi:hypothetical protein|nr:hypothetical protein [Acidobacteriaceae bacterium]